jgi:hypothetical protein
MDKIQIFECREGGTYNSDFWSFCAVYVQRHSLFFLRTPLLDTTCFGLTGHLQVYRLLWLTILLLPVIRVSFLLLQLPLVILVMWVTISFIWVSVGCTWLLLFVLLVLSALNVLAEVGVLLCVGRP